MRRVVFGISDWPDSEDFEIVEVTENESDDEAIKRAKSYYSPDLECYVREIKD